MTQTELIDPRYFEAAAARLCELSLIEFVEEAWKVIEPGTPYVPSWHVRAICEHLEACTRGEIRRLIINVPPRCMKSRLVSVFWPAWVWITHPHKRWLFSSYGQHLSLRDSRHCRDIILSPWYQRNWGHRFRLRDDQNQKVRFDNSHAGFRLASSTGGIGTGEGGDFIVTDDPHNVVEAESETQRESVLRWWDQSMSTRGNDPKTVCHVVVMQRLHECDLAGHLLDQGGYEHLRLPMEFEADDRCRTSIGWSDPRKREGELLCPERFGPTEVKELRLRLGSYAAAGQLQQAPAPREGGLFQKAWFQIVDKPPVARMQRTRYWDLAATLEGDYTVGVLMSRLQDGRYCVDEVLRGRWSPADRDALIIETAKRDGQGVTIVLEQEPGSAGKSVFSWHARMLAGYPVFADRPTGAKEVRAQPFAAQCEAGNVLVVKAGWNRAFIDELCVFPNGRNDDQVDSSSGAFNKLSRYAAYYEGPQFLPESCAGAAWRSVHLDRSNSPFRHGVPFARN